MKKMRVVAVALSLVSVAIFFAGCKKSEKKLVAKAGSIKIYDEDFTRELSNLPADYQNYLSTLEGKKQLLDILLREKILLNLAEKSAVSKKKEIQKNLKEFRERKKEEEIEFRKGLILREYLRELQDGVLKVTEPELKLYYEQNKSDFENPKKITASHILSASQSDAEKALSRLKKGEDFAKVARELSTDPSSSRGGMIGEVGRGDLADLPEFENELFHLKSGQISQIVKTKLGYHIIKKTGEIALPGQAFQKVAPQIRRILEKRKFDQWMDKTKREEKLWVDENVLASIPVPSTERTAAVSKLNR